MARLFLSPGETLDAVPSQTSTIFAHQDSAESVTLQANSKTTFDGSFSAGGDTIRILGNAELYKATIDGGNLVLTATNGARIVIPYGLEGITLVFNNATREMSFNEAQGVVVVGSQQIETGAGEQLNNGTVDPTPSSLLRLTTTLDILEGTSGNDEFRATVQQNALGFETNSLGTGDELDGGDGIDTLNAQMTEGVTLGGASSAVQPDTIGIEYIDIEAKSNQQGSNYLTYGMTEVYLDAGDIKGHTRFSSSESDGNLTIQDATTLDNNNSIRNLSALTVRMEYTGNDDSRWEESDFSVLFDQDYLNPSLVAVRSARIELQAMNEDNWDKTLGAEPLAGVYFSQLQFTLNGTTFDLAPFLPAATDNRPGSDGRELLTYDQFLTAVQAAIVGLKAANPGNAALQTLTASLGDQFLSDISPVTNTQRVGTSIDLTVAPSTGGTTNVLTAEQTDLVLIPTPGLDPNVLPNSNRFERANFVPPESEEQLAINIDLEKVGRAGDGGELVVGSMNKYDVGESDFRGESTPLFLPTQIDPDTFLDSQWDNYYSQSFPGAPGGGAQGYYEGFLGPNGVLTSLLGDYGRGTFYKSYPNVWDDDFAASGISTFNVTVFGGADKPSSLSGLHSTNNTLREVNVVTDAAQTGTFADLEIGNDNTIGGRRGAFKDVALFNSTGFKGDLSLVAALTEELDSKYNPDNQQPTEEPILINYQFGAGNDELNMEIGENYSQMTNVSINMGAGDDRAYVNIDGDAVDAVTESFFLNLGEGNNKAYVFDWDFYGLEYERQDPQGVTNNVSGILFPNLTIISGSGADKVEIAGNGQYYINTSGGSDTVFIDQNYRVGDTSGGGSNSGTDGDIWLWDPDFWGSSLVDGLTPLDDGIALYKATLQIRYAGIEGTAQILTGTDLIATEQDFNNAIRTAISSNPELARMLETELGTIDQNLLFRSLIGAQNQLEIAVFQPELIPFSTTVAPTVTGTQIRLTSAETNALEAALIATGMAEDSAAIAAADAGTDKNVDVVTYFNSAFSSAWGGFASPGQTHGNLGGLTQFPADTDLNGYVFYAHSLLGRETSSGGHVNHSVIDVGSGANDLISLDDNDASHNVIVFDEIWGKTTILNWFTNEHNLHATTTPVAFSDGPGTTPTFQGVNGLHQLDVKGLFTSFAKISSSGSGVSTQDKLIGVFDSIQNSPDASTAPAALNAAGAFQANNIVFANIDRLEEASAAAGVAPNLNFAGLTTTQVLAALNAAGGYGSDTEEVGGAGHLVTGTTTRQSLLFVENVDTPFQTVSAAITGTGSVVGGTTPEGTNYANYGHYKVYRITYGDGDGAGNSTLGGGSTNGHFTTATLLGEVDFGNSLDTRPFTEVPGSVDRYEFGDREHYVQTGTNNATSGYDALTNLTFNIVGGAYEIG